MKTATITANHCQTLGPISQFKVHWHTICKLAFKSAIIILSDVKSATILWACMRSATIMHILCDVCMCNVVCVGGLFNIQFFTFIGKSLVGRWKNKSQGLLNWLHWMKTAAITDNHCQTLGTITQFIGTAVNEKLAIKLATIILSDIKSATIMRACTRLVTIWKMTVIFCVVCVCVLCGSV